MKKLLIFFSLFWVISAVHAISIGKYIQRYGLPEIRNGVLDLKNKDITSLEGIEFVDDPTLIKSLDLSENNIQRILPIHISRFTNLEHLDLAKNFLSTLPQLKLNYLKSLKINDNNIETLSNLHFPQLQKLELKNNPLKKIINLHAPLLKDFKVRGSSIKTIADIDIDEGEIEVG